MSPREAKHTLCTLHVIRHDVIPVQNEYKLPQMQENSIICEN
jgi:hypothetical protein